MPLLAEGHRIGPYRIIRLLGEGGMGAVYEARQEPLDRRVALKTLKPDYARDHDAVARFFTEAKILSRLEHPSIVQVSDFGDAPDGTAYLVMEYLRGHSLGHRLGELVERGERLPLLTALQLAFQIADALAVAHAQGIVHRDLKPDNLMLVADPVAPSGERVKLLDFGIAKLTRPSDKAAAKTDTQAVMGTPLYMSPEQCAGAGGVDAKSDVYSLGCVLYEALAGRPPFVAEGAGQLIGMHLFQTPKPLGSVAPKVPAAVADLVHSLLTKDKTQRLGMSEAADAIGKLLAKLSGAGPVVRSRLVSSTDSDATRAVLVQPPSTTLGRSVGQSQLARLGRSSRSLLMILAGVMVVLFCGIWIMGTHTSSPSSAKSSTQFVPTPVTSLLPAASKPSSNIVSESATLHTVTWRIDSEPAGAVIVDDAEHVIGRTPFATVRKEEPGKSVLRLRQRGYVEAIITLYRNHDADQRITLQQLKFAPTRRASALPIGSPPVQSSPLTPNASPKKKIGYEE